MDFTKIAVGVVLLLLYMLIPGIALSLAAFPRRRDLGLVERAGISVFFGLFVSYIQYFNDKNFFVPINTSTTLMTFIAVTFIGLAIWQLRLRMAESRRTVSSAPAEAQAVEE
jgi:uncharacterized membrane protein